MVDVSVIGKLLVVGRLETGVKRVLENIEDKVAMSCELALLEASCSVIKLRCWVVVKVESFEKIGYKQKVLFQKTNTRCLQRLHHCVHVVFFLHFIFYLVFLEQGNH